MNYPYSTIKDAVNTGDINSLNRWKEPVSDLIMRHGLIDQFITLASWRGQVSVLEWLHNNFRSLFKCSEYAINFAAASNFVNVLDWWKNKSGETLYYTNDAIDSASAYGYIEVLNWWKTSGLPLKYSSNAFGDAVLYINA
jgi:hypothetical protein